MDFSTDSLNNVAGIAALVNSLLLWPVIRSLKSLASNHDLRITRLETKPRSKAKRAR